MPRVLLTVIIIQHGSSFGRCDQIFGEAAAPLLVSLRAHSVLAIQSVFPALQNDARNKLERHWTIPTISEPTPHPEGMAK